MKAISVRQPFATAIANGEKTVEWRSWRTRHRGEILICSGKAWDSGRGADWEMESEEEIFFPRGVALCVATLDQVVPFAREHLEHAVMEEIPSPSGFAWKLSKIRKITLFPVLGKQGLFEVAFHG